MSSQEGLQRNMIPVRRAVINDILSIQQECCPSLQPEEFVIDPSELQHCPIDKPLNLLLFDIADIASSVISKKPGVISFTKRKGRYVDKPLKSLLPLEGDRGHDISIFLGRNIRVRMHVYNYAVNVIIFTIIIIMQGFKLPGGHKLLDSNEISSLQVKEAQLFLDEVEDDEILPTSDSSKENSDDRVDGFESIGK